MRGVQCFGDRWDRAGAAVPADLGPGWPGVAGRLHIPGCPQNLVIRAVNTERPRRR